jgi:hypothetical protein
MSSDDRTPRFAARRRFLAGAAGASATGLAAAGGLAPSAAVAAAGAPPRPGTTGPLDLASAPGRQLAYRKLRYRTDEGLVFWWLEGPKIGQVGATLTPLYTNHVGTIMRIRPRADGGFDVTSLEIVFMSDLASGAPLESWVNPYTGERLPARVRPVGPTTVSYAADNSRVLPTELGGSRLEASATTHAPIVTGDDVFLRDESVARVWSPGATRPFEVNDIAVYHGSLSNLGDPRTTSGDAIVFFAEVTSWQRWMNMGDRPGSLTSRLGGRKVARYEDMPAFWREQLARLAPEVARDPAGALDRPAAKFER